MRLRFLAAIGAPLIAMAVASFAPVTIASQAPTIPRTPWGDPDFQGIWRQEYQVPLERPAAYAGKEFLTDAELAALRNRPESENLGRDKRQPRGTEEDVAGAYNHVWEGGDGRGRGRGNRTSMIVNPSDGRIPAFTEAAKSTIEKERAYRAALQKDPRKAVDPGTYNVVRTNRADNPEDRDPAERCLGARVPDIGGIARIVQSPGAIAIYHEAGQGGGYNRIIPVDGTPHLPPHIRQYLGDARGHWEGNTLVVDTTNFTRTTNFHGSRENLHLIERYTPIDTNTFRYEVTVEDPTTWVRPWTVMTTMMKDNDKANLIFESTCHEGNYGLVGMLANTRAAEKAFKEGRGPDPAKMKLDIGGAEGLPPDAREQLLREGGVRR